MATIVFDFDSTLVQCESLEWILEEQLKGKPEVKKQIHEITLKGLKGIIPFSESLTERLKLAAPNRKAVAAFGQKALKMITSGIPELISKYKKDGVDIWVISGGLYESLVPACKHLGINEECVMGVRLLWGNQGEFLGIDPNDPLSRSKSAAAAAVSFLWSRPCIVVGDSVSDYQLFNEGIADEFVLYTEHIECTEIAKLDVKKANNTKKLKEMIDAILE
ncbi:phosphoserine phosphatase, chloroplastic [Waddlia chondrophila 2032/99]|uniref:phosphoserine phosphatase n=2 Tax=Waddlia chondrophila TaxID=71667 RepID=D6YTH1_WADCW|nr:HAD-IB family phosphatase [Waddlia chondrophila]ADI37432.1 Phosphoserine phosphatase [Waddlia chondrophila WSU 86-1044]CCB90855.1 phosphoserine phosphatase, chloroplastic [Waddlia chondrophila 2032/99]